MMNEEGKGSPGGESALKPYLGEVKLKKLVSTYQNTKGEVAMKKLTIIQSLALVVATVFTASQAFAVDFTIEADLPASNGATFAVSKVTKNASNQDVFTAFPSTNLDFLTLSLNTDLGVFLPTFAFAIDVGANGAGQPDIQASYTDTANPNGALNNGDGLGGHGTITFLEVVTNPDLTQTSNVINGMSLGEVTAFSPIQETAFADGFLRIFVGMATGDPNLDEGNATPFTALDQPGTYSGTLTLTATFD
jgi:hypothetical protein